MYGIGGINKMNFNEKNDYYKKQKEYIESEILNFKLDCDKCHNVEYWTIQEFDWCGDYPYECDKCRHDELNITLINK